MPDTGKGTEALAPCPSLVGEAPLEEQAMLNEAATRRGTVVQAARSKKTASAEG